MSDERATGAAGEQPAGAGAPIDEDPAFVIPGEGGEVLDAEVALAADAETEAPDEESAVAPEPDWHDRFLRSAAELDNVRKRARRDAGVAEIRGISRLARELLPALDNLDRAIASAEAEETDQEHHLTKGIRLVQAELVASLGKVGIEPFNPLGEAFDPHRHEAIAQAPREGAVTGTIIEVYQLGYRLGEDVLRPAKVVVAA
jgi:molecular chaperone GrpE